MTTSEISLAAYKPPLKHKRKVEETYWRVLTGFLSCFTQSLPDVFISLVSLLQVGVIFPVCE